VIRNLSGGIRLDGCDEEGAFFSDVMSRLLAVDVPFPGKAIEFTVEPGQRPPVRFKRPERFVSIHAIEQTDDELPVHHRPTSFLVEEMSLSMSQPARSTVQRRLFASMLNITDTQTPSRAITSFDIPVIYDAIDEEGLMLQRHAVPNLLKIMPIAEILMVLGCALAEMKIVFISKSLFHLSTCALGLQALLRPLSWDGLFIPILPSDPRMEGVLYSPSPIIVGMQKLPEDFEVLPNLVVVNIDDAGRLEFNAEESRRCHTVKFPHLDTLAHDLSECSMRHLQQYDELQNVGKMRTTEPDKLAEDYQDVAQVARCIFDRIQTICEAALRIDVEEAELSRKETGKVSGWLLAALDFRKKFDPDGEIGPGVEGYELGQAAANNAASKRFGREGSANANEALEWVGAVGQSGLPFLDRFRKTQMYSNYRYNVVI